jgi:hypothetical protein
MPMKSPPHPGGMVLQDCIEPLGLTVTGGGAGTRRFALYAFGPVERQAGHISGDGHTSVEGVWGEPRELACTAGAVRPCPSESRPD